MRQIAVVLLALLLSCSGCRAPDVLFALFGDHYTNGTTRADKYNAYCEDLRRQGNKDY
jgi:hypothetical protein